MGEAFERMNNIMDKPRGTASELLKYMHENKIFKNNPRKSKDMANKRGGSDSLRTIQKEVMVLRRTGLVEGDGKNGYYLKDWLSEMNENDIYWLVVHAMALTYPNPDDSQIQQAAHRVRQFEEEHLKEKRLFKEREEDGPILEIAKKFNLNVNLLLFYFGRMLDHCGRNISEIWKFDHKKLEEDHIYIQLLFPTDKEPGFVFTLDMLNSGKSKPDIVPPILWEKDVKYLQKSKDEIASSFRANMLKSLDLMLDFYGLQYSFKNDKIIIERSPTFEERQSVWLSKDNHNFMRITRILKSLRLCGLDKYSVALFNALSELHEIEEYKTIIDYSASFDYWKGVVKGLKLAQVLTQEEFESDKKAVGAIETVINKKETYERAGKLLHFHKEPEEFLVNYMYSHQLCRHGQIAVVIKSTDQLLRNQRHLQRYKAKITIGGRNVQKDAEAGIVLLSSLDIDEISPTNFRERIDIEEPTGFDVFGSKIVIASWNKLIIYDFTSNEVKIIRNDWFANLHTAVFSKDGKSVLVASPGFDMILEVAVENGEVIWEWCAWEHGYPVSKSEKYFFTRDRLFKDVERHLGREVVYVDNPQKYKGYGIPVGDRANHLNGAIYDFDDNILATLYHRGKVIKIDRKTKIATELYSDLTQPHGLGKDGAHGYIVTSTGGENARLEFLDQDFKLLRKIRVSGVPGIREGLPESLEWLQYTTRIDENIYAMVDIHRSAIFLVNPKDRTYRTIRLPKEWSVQMIVPVSEHVKLPHPRLLSSN